MPKQLWKPSTLLYPVPAVLVSSKGKEGPPNVLTVAWTGTVCSEPPMLSISVRPERYSHALITQSGEFVVNLPTKKLIRAVDLCGVKSGKDMDKFAAAGLTPAPSSVVKAPIIEECPVNIECRVTQAIPLGSHDMFIGEIVTVHVEGELMDKKGHLDLARANLIAWVHGHYAEIGKMMGYFGFSVRKRGRRKA
ncbi:MAG TPA: flavin reductase family protein [Firmicutes bacterium]|nr:flavin reductase family protein [Bacillota bacterium]